MSCEKCGHKSPLERELEKWPDMPEMKPYDGLPKPPSRWVVWVKRLFGLFLAIIILIGIIKSS